MWDDIRRSLFPAECVGCGAERTLLCAACAPGASRRIDVVVEGGLHVRACGTYDGDLRAALLRLKGGERAAIDALAPLLAELPYEAEPGTAIVPVPTTWWRANRRGFDQAVDLARRVAAARGMTYSAPLLRRGLAQHGADRAGRLERGGRYCVGKCAVVPREAILLDDVCTTGATLRDAAAALRGAGTTVRGALVVAYTAPAAPEPPERSPGTSRYPERVVGGVMKAVWNGTVIAESPATEIVEGNHYFPADSVKREFFKPSATHTVCPWKGTASYYTLEVNGKQNPDAAWFYPQTKEKAKNIEGYVAFWKGVEVQP